MRAILLLLLIQLVACGTPKQAESKTLQKTASPCVIDSGSLKKDPAMETYLKPYRSKLDGKISEVLADLKIDLTRGTPDNTLGRFAAEVIRLKAKEYSKLPVDFAVLNNGGLRKELAKGKLNLGDLYELMPFDNYIVLISYSGKQVKQLCNEIAAMKGTPLSGLQIELNSDYKVLSCTINNKNIDDQKNYSMATINYLYQIGDGLPTLMKGTPIKLMYQRLFRDALIEYARQKKVIDGVIPVQINIKGGK